MLCSRPSMPVGFHLHIKKIKFATTSDVSNLYNTTDGTHTVFSVNSHFILEQQLLANFLSINRKLTILQHL